MPGAEVSVGFRHRCTIDGCNKGFNRKLEYDSHQIFDHGIKSEEESETLSSQSDDEVEAAESIPCTYPGCKVIFTTIQAMKYHKMTNKEHEYCDKCDVDCQDWDDMVRHKANSDNHKSCPVCGADFKADGGLQRHVKERHMEVKELDCPGCNKPFYKAGLLIGHLEMGRCKSIPQQTFHEHVLRREIAHKLLRDPNPPNEWSDSTSDVDTVNRLTPEGSSMSLAPSGSSKSSSSASSIEIDDVRSNESSINSVTTTIKLGATLPDLNARFWDPRDRSYTPETFFNLKLPVPEYECLHRNCSYSFRTGEELTAHLRHTNHAKTKRECPRCGILFQSLAALVSHCETPNARCDIRHQKYYSRVFNRLTGGFVTVTVPDVKAKIDAHRKAISDQSGRASHAGTADEMASATGEERLIRIKKAIELTNSEPTYAATWPSRL